MRLEIRSLPGPVRRVVAVLFVVEVVGIAWLVLNPSPAVPTSSVFWISFHLMRLGAPTWLSEPAVWEYVLNVALFAPLGFFAALLWPRVPLWGWVVLSFSTSAALETVQLVFLTARTASPKDVSSNTVGTFVGALLAELVVMAWSRRSAARDRPATGLARPTRH